MTLTPVPEPVSIALFTLGLDASTISKKS
ncbi:MAG: PEP-CTERM sorting domain-containing protein [Polyangiaceae bacterium]